MSLILINAIAAKVSGARTILKNCVEYVENNPGYEIEYHLLTVIDDFNEYKNLKIHKLKTFGFLSRIIWDNGGLQNWCRNHNIEPDIIISMHNTSTNYTKKNGQKALQLIYFHHPFPLYTWKGMNHNFNLLLHHFLYPIFVKMNSINCHYVVQLNCIKDLFCKKFKNIAPDRIMVIRPNRPMIDVNHRVPKVMSKNDDRFVFLYPSTLFGYKNHKVLIHALVELKRNNPDILENILLTFTVDRLSNDLMKIIKNKNIGSCIRFLGQIPYTELLSYYKSAGALLFPSKIESFGLPLLEASNFGLTIIASNLQYAREVLEDYDNKYFYDPDNINEWVIAIQNYKYYKNIFHGNSGYNENTWKQFFELSNRLIGESILHG